MGAAQVNPDDDGGDGAADARDGEGMPVEDFDKKPACTPQQDREKQIEYSLAAIHRVRVLSNFIE
jgi:hypothetical protein